MFKSVKQQNGPSQREQLRQAANAWPVLMTRCVRALETERADEFLALMRRLKNEMAQERSARSQPSRGA